MKRSGEGLVAMGLVMIAAAAFVQSFQAGGGMNTAATDAPMRLPRILLGLWIAVGLACAAKTAVGVTSPERPRVHLWRVAPFAGVSLSVAVLLPILGYLIAITIGFAALVMLVGERSPLRGAVAIGLLGPGLWYLFHHILGLRLPALLSGGGAL